MKQLSRKEKIKLLKAIQRGQISVESLQPPKVYVFIERNDKPGVYVMDGKEFNEKEYLEFCARIKQKNKSAVIWNETKEYLKEDSIITFKGAVGCKPLNNSSI